MRDATPLPGHDARHPAPVAIPSQLEPAASGPVPAPVPASEFRPAPQPVALRSGAPAPGLDRRTGEKLARGRIALEARLDLHGMTQDQARGALDAFIGRAWDTGLRGVLVITGKGGAGGDDWGAPGVLRRNVPRWLAETPNRGRVLAFTEAQPRHGGAGALYILIRRRRS
jgi:DNA-nicking Smr family endonuclease